MEMKQFMNTLRFKILRPRVYSTRWWDCLIKIYEIPVSWKYLQELTKIRTRPSFIGHKRSKTSIIDQSKISKYFDPSKESVFTMVQGRRTSPELQQQVLTLRELGKSIDFIMKKTGLGKTCVKDICRRNSIKYKNEYSSPPGRPKKILKNLRKKIKDHVKKNERITLRSSISELKLEVSKPTLSRVFREIGISKRKMKDKPTLTNEHQKKRVDWALSQCSPDFDWSEWIFSDERNSI